MVAGGVQGMSEGVLESFNNDPVALVLEPAEFENPSLGPFCWPAACNSIQNLRFFNHLKP